MAAQAAGRGTGAPSRSRTGNRGGSGSGSPLAPTTPSRTRRTGIALTAGLAIAVTLALVATWTAGSLVGATPSAAASPSNALASSDWSTTPLNLLGGASHVSKSLVENGHQYSGRTTGLHKQDRSYPQLLTGSSSSPYWTGKQPVMLLGPYSDTDGTEGLLLFSTASAATVELRTVAAYELGPSGSVLSDGLTAYFFLDPTHVGNWSTPFTALGPYLNSSSTHIKSEGVQMFPYSTSPYVVVQWDPANGYSAGFNVYVVHPEPSGKVTALSVQADGQLGSTDYVYPGPGSLIDFNVSYSATSNSVKADVRDPSDSAVMFNLSFSLNRFGFVPNYSPTVKYYVGFAGDGGGGTYAASWGVYKITATGAGTLVATSPAEWYSASPIWSAVQSFEAKASAVSKAIRTA